MYRYFPLVGLAVLLVALYHIPASGQSGDDLYLPFVGRAGDVSSFTATPIPSPTDLPTNTVIPDTPTPTPSPTDTATATATVNPAVCDPAYPTVCIAPPPPDLDCGDIPYRRFAVLSPDPHNFDADHDGIGCESG